MMCLRTFPSYFYTTYLFSLYILLYMRLNCLCCSYILFCLTTEPSSIKKRYSFLVNVGINIFCRDFHDSNKRVFQNYYHPQFRLFITHMMGQKKAPHRRRRRRLMLRLNSWLEMLFMYVDSQSLYNMYIWSVERKIYLLS